MSPAGGENKIDGRSAATDLEQKNYGSRRGMCWCPVLAAHDQEGALANIPCQDADCVSWIGVKVYGSAARLEFTVAQNERSMTPCEKSKSMTMRDSCWKHTARRPLRKLPRTPSPLK